LGYGVVMPSDVDSIFLDGLEYQDLCRWDVRDPDPGCV
jgi:hypothetical protein